MEAAGQRCTREVNETLKQGAAPARWKKNPAKRRPRDHGARWAQENDEDHYEYKTHVSVGPENDFVVCALVTVANLHRSQAFEDLPCSAGRNGPDAWPDSGYRSNEHERRHERRGSRSRLHVRQVPTGSAGRMCVFATLIQMSAMLIR